jgi:hypothetical protein
VICEHYGEEIPHVLVCYGKKIKQKIMYDVVEKDLDLIEKRMLEVSTSFINRYERYVRLKSLSEIVDRVELLNRIYELELKYCF